VDVAIGARSVSFDPLDARAMWRVHTLRTKEPETIDWIEGFAPGSTFWDVGASIGVYSLYAAALGHRVIAFEPDANQYAQLIRNIAKSDLGDHVQAFHMAIDSGPPGWRNIGGLKVQAVSLSDIIDWYEWPVDYLKIDTDGDDFDVLKSLHEYIAAAPEVQIEIDNRRTDAATIRQLLKTNGYTFKRRSISPLTPESPIGNELWQREQPRSDMIRKPAPKSRQVSS
jgi:hypothetical protein